MYKIPAVLIASITALALAACGGSSSSSTSSSAPASSSATSTSSSAPASSAAAGGGGGTITEAADPGGQLKFTKATLSAKAGSVSIDFTNSSSLPHNITIQQGTSGPNVGATPTFAGGKKTLVVKLKPGTYTFYCSVPGHRQAGMQGTLTVS
ncbi:MAG: plastocyanin/azurin family copper-binding protein [Solirubrobacteraceae bacterium]|jgi:plastocyanin